MSTSRVLGVLIASSIAIAPIAAVPSARADAPAQAPPVLPAPVAAGSSASNMTLNGRDRWVVMRWVARRTGTLDALHMRLEADGSDCDRTGRRGYGLGNGGSWLATTHPVLADGRPDMGTTLATQQFRPCEGPVSVVDVPQGIVRLTVGIAVQQGNEYATVVRNSDPDPAANYSSTNFLFTAGGLVGANARNERSRFARDAYYGLDPRELVGYSEDGGRSWALPGGQNGEPDGRNFLPTYIQEFSDGTLTGQPYYYTADPSSADRTMVYRNVRGRWVIRQLGAFALAESSGTLTLTVDGVQRAQVAVEGAGMLRAAIDPVTVAAGQTVKVTASGLAMRNIVADTAWGRLLGFHLATKPWYVEAQSNFTHAAPIYALPAYGVSRTVWVHAPRPSSRPAAARSAKRSCSSKRRASTKRRCVSKRRGARSRRA
jgi:hypothetical protein